MRKFLFLVVVVICAVIPISAQTELSLKQYFEGKHVTLTIEMPASKDGVNVYPERAQPLDYSEYANRLKKYGTSVRRGEEIMITKVKAKDKHIEFQLGGGYGTGGDETDSSAYVASASKTNREKSVEEELKRENDVARRKRLKEELDDLRRRREREDQRNRAIAADAQEARRARIERKALQGGSRFNVYFAGLDSRTLSPEVLIDALRKYVDFSDLEKSPSFLRQISYRYVAGDSRKPRVIRVGPPTTYVKEGLRTEEVLRLLGKPVATSERVEQGLVVTTYEFLRGGGRVLVADFVSDALVRARIETRGKSMQADGINF